MNEFFKSLIEILFNILYLSVTFHGLEIIIILNFQYNIIISYFLIFYNCGNPSQTPRCLMHLQL